MGLYRYRVFQPGSLAKAERIAETRAEVEIPILHGENRIVCRYQGRKKLATYRVERDVRGGVIWTQLIPPRTNFTTERS